MWLYDVVYQMLTHGATYSLVRPCGPRTSTCLLDGAWRKPCLLLRRHFRACYICLSLSLPCLGLQALCIAACYAEDWPLLVVCPPSLRYAWAQVRTACTLNPTVQAQV